ncbi:predicted protein [Nematostella vectensis]|uniref:Transmembrane protein 43 homolog n=1 Tax=Nematostella vectensis TaxID=45351 RepID=A7T0P6_NEMVE|nr:predicted protein [Nematostella vectensis]|eukprot:XP_001622563.1 predicted protein [Nematostella vectensis]
MASNDSHTRVTYQENPGIMQNIQSSFAASLVGIGLVLTAFPVLYWNEGRAVQTSLSLDEGLRAVIPLHSINEINRKNQDKLVHLVGHLHTDKVEEMLKILRSWFFNKEWLSHIVNSHQFDNPHGHQNPTSMAVSSQTQEAAPVHVGAFTLSRGLISKIDEFHPLPAKSAPSGKDVKVVDGIFYHSLNGPYNPTVGDVRVRFSFAGFCGAAGSQLSEPMTVSIVARQHGGTLSYYRTQSGDTLELLYPGEMTAKEIFYAEHSANSVLTWVLRVVGWFLMFLGFLLMTSILTTLVSWLPIIREIVGLGVTLICFCLATSFSLVTIAIGWIAHRPVLGVALLAAAAVPFYLSRQRNRKNKESKY